MAHVESCPQCETPFGGGGISSGLGSPTYRCALCGHAFVSFRKEWPHMFPVEKAWYIAVSAGYVVLAAIVHGGLTWHIISTLIGRPALVTAKSFWTDQFLLVCMAAAGSAVLVMQCLRVKRSIARASLDPPYCAEAYFLSLETNRQLIVLFIAILLMLIASLL
jgi:hypothetical protein